MPPPPTDSRAEEKLIRVTIGLAYVFALLIAVLVPVAYFCQGLVFLSGRLEADTEIRSRLINEAIAAKPNYWEFEAEKLGRLLRPHTIDDTNELHQIIDTTETLLIQAPAYLREDELRPLLTYTQPLVSGNKPVGRVESHVSLRPLLIHTGAAGATALLVSLALFYVLRVLTDQALRRALDSISYMGSHDTLTGLPNRVLFHDRLEQTLAQHRRDVMDSAILFVDLDHFKDVNDTLGHAVGDRLLKTLARRMATAIRETDTVARLGGDEFAIIQRGIRRPEDSANLAQRLLGLVAEPCRIDGHELVVSCSIGIAAPVPGIDADTLLRNADLALYRAKSEGRRIFRFFEEQMNERLQSRKSLEAELRRALAEGQFRVFYQPQFSLASGSLIGVEALLRWQHPQKGMIPPDQFIPIAEETGLIQPLGLWVLETACREVRDWGHLMLAVNLSPVQFRQSDLVAAITQILGTTMFDPGRLEVEITEGILVQAADGTYETLQNLKDLGIHIALDDFGTGYSSISHLRRFHFDKIKIDRSFVNGLGRDTDSEGIVRAILALGRSLGIRLNAEGIETAEQAETLLREGCEEVQGFLYGRPVSPADFVEQWQASLPSRARIAQR